ncbi:recombinase family protein [Pseudoflavonifractor phocaeensis]|uniref:recombinase family protein n=1 Tax=Pseudoflavonifractor phocaeensis TaxID=1870988 RepID=UPI00195673F2|nr:recombinase family protein [Pseudoflavonifractor phocaeensis]MBM6886907.1 recombinase family protein [Pseudoflavonifractor phocaeensis]
MGDTFYGYIRVSSKDQNEARQIHAMQEFGVTKENMVIEKQSGKDFQQPLYQKLVDLMHPGDVLVIKSIDRLGRNYTEILEQWAYLTKKRNIAVVVLDMPLLDTRQGRDLTGTLIADIVLQLLSYVAETERQNIRQRQAEGIAAAKKRGVHFGRKKIEMPDLFNVLATEYMRGTLSSRDAAAQLGISGQTFLRRIREKSSHTI